MDVKKASAYIFFIAQYPVLRTAQSALHFTSLTDLFTQTPSQLLWEASSHMLQLMHEDGLYTYPPLSIASYSFIQLSELEQCRMKKLAQGFNTAAYNSNLDSSSRESEALPLSHCTLQTYATFSYCTHVFYVYKRAVIPGELLLIILSVLAAGNAATSNAVAY